MRRKRKHEEAGNELARGGGPNVKYRNALFAIFVTRKYVIQISNNTMMSSVII